MNRRSAFTLVELLVVIGIIAALLAILFPALSRARYEANVTVCAANLEQWGVSIQSYAADNRGYFPRQDLPGTGRNLWDVSLDFYGILNTQYGLPHSAFFCPLMNPDIADSFWDYFGYFNIVGYEVWIPRLNGGVTVPPEPGDPGFIYADNNSFRGPIRMGEPQVNSAPFITDFVDTQGATIPPPGTDLSREMYIGFDSNACHQRDPGLIESANEAYADGHVERVRGGDLRPRYFGNIWNWR